MNKPSLNVNDSNYTALYGKFKTQSIRIKVSGNVISFSHVTYILNKHEQNNSQLHYLSEIIRFKDLYMLKVYTQCSKYMIFVAFKNKSF